MQATITYLLTEQAQRAQMAATGQPVARKQTITVEVPAEDLEFYPVADDGSIAVNLAHATSLGGRRISDVGRDLEFAEAPSVPDLIRAAIARERAAEDKLKADLAANLAVQNAAVERFFADPALRINDSHDCVYIGATRVDSTQNAYHAACPRFAELYAEGARRRKIDAVEAARIKAEKDARDLAKETAKREFIDRWISAHADDATKRQHAEKLLCRAAATDMIAQSVLDPIGAAYFFGVFCDSSECPCGSHSIDCLPRSVYPAWLELKAKLPEGSTFDFLSGRECLKDDDGYFEGDGESAGPRRYAIELKIPYGPFVFDRQIRLRSTRETGAQA